MSVLAGIDEAGYGPHLGPLVVASAAIEFSSPHPPDPDLWNALRGHISKQRAGAGPRVVVCDSKKAYSGGGDLATLERAVLGFLASCGQRPRSLAELLEMTHPNPAHAAGNAADATEVPVAQQGSVIPREQSESRNLAVRETAAPISRRDPSASLGVTAKKETPETSSYGDAAETPLPRPWHQPQSLGLPVAATPDAIDAAAAHITDGLKLLAAWPRGVWINVASAARFNRLVAAGRNKADALFFLNAEILTAILGREPREAALITMDRHGGRRYYGDLLAGAFPMTTVETIEELPGLSRYRLLRGEAPAVHIVVRDRCESWSLATALASMVAKYVRELYMGQLNAYFRSLVPELRPTAGYGLDAWRFLDEVAAARAAAGVPDAAILRTR